MRFNSMTTEKKQPFTETEMRRLEEEKRTAPYFD
jgi:hypothetical protein